MVGGALFPGMSKISSGAPSRFCFFDIEQGDLSSEIPTVAVGFVGVEETGEEKMVVISMGFIEMRFHWGS